MASVFAGLSPRSLAELGPIPLHCGSIPLALCGCGSSLFVQDKDELFETMAQCLLTSVDRDALSGWGGVVHIITPEGIMSKTLKGRQD